MKASGALLSAALALLSGCAAGPGPAKTALELQAIQAKEFECTKQLAFAATLSVFQDLGYIVSSASIDTGLITAKSPTKKSFLPFLGFRMQDRKATAFIEEAGKDRAKVRLNFVDSAHTSVGYGIRTEEDTPVESPELYQETFQKIQQAVFIRKNLQ